MALKRPSHHASHPPTTQWERPLRRSKKGEAFAQSFIHCGSFMVVGWLVCVLISHINKHTTYTIIHDNYTIITRMYNTNDTPAACAGCEFVARSGVPLSEIVCRTAPQVRLNPECTDDGI